MKKELLAYTSPKVEVISTIYPLNILKKLSALGSFDPIEEDEDFFFDPPGDNSNNDADK